MGWCSIPLSTWLSQQGPLPQSTVGGAAKVQPWKKYFAEREIEYAAADEDSVVRMKRVDGEPDRLGGRLEG
jgi:hypothetical protein